MFGKKDKNAPEPSTLRTQLEGLRDPELDKTLGETATINDINVDSKRVRISLNWPTPAWRSRVLVEQQIQETLKPHIGGREVDFARIYEVKRSRGTSTNDFVAGAANVILFASGKGGVGKSTVASNVAIALAQAGASVGLLDADVYGPSVPTMVGTDRRPEVSGERLVPLDCHGLKVMSIGFIVSSEDAMVWRGPMLNAAVTQMLRDVEWGPLDYLIIDMPPGTGDVQLTIAQNLKVSGAVLISTPQKVALADVVRGKAMFDKVDIPTLGIVENMSYFVCANCQTRHNIFASGGARQLGERLEIPVLGEVPLEEETRVAADDGRPAVLSNPGGVSSRVFRTIAEGLATMLAKKAMDVTSRPSGLKIIQ